MSHVEDIQKLIEQHARRLQKLKEKEAIKGINVDPSVSIEIENIEEKIDRLKLDLEKTEQATESDPNQSYPADLKLLYDKLNQIQEQLNTIEQSEASKATSIEPKHIQTSGFADFFKRWRLVGGGAILLIVAILLSLWLFRDTSSSATPIAGQDYCRPMLTPVRVGLAQLEGCPDTYQSQLVEAWHHPHRDEESTKAKVDVTELSDTMPPIKLETITNQYDLEVWGTCQNVSEGDVQLSVSLNPLTPRKPDEIYEPSLVTVTTSIDQAELIGWAMANYQYGTYQEAQETFEQLSDTVMNNSRELALFEANNLLYNGKHERAITVYESISLRVGFNWSAVHLNLGMAQFDKAWSQSFQEQNLQHGLQNLTKATQLAEDQGETELAMLAYANKSLLHLFEFKSDEPSWSDALNSCNEAQRLNQINSHLPNFCLAYYHLFKGNFLSETAYSDETEQYLELLGQNSTNDPPAKLQLVEANLREKRGEDQLAYTAYRNFVHNLKHRACLNFDEDLYTNVQSVYNIQ